MTDANAFWMRLVQMHLLKAYKRTVKPIEMTERVQRIVSQLPGAGQDTPKEIDALIQPILTEKRVLTADPETVALMRAIQAKEGPAHLNLQLMIRSVVDTGMRVTTHMPAKVEADLRRYIIPDDLVRIFAEKYAYPMQYKDRLYRSEGIVMHGVPGTGKTVTVNYMAAKLCEVLNRPVRVLSPSPADTKDKYIGETEKYVEKLFVQAQLMSLQGMPAGYEAITVIVFDEVETLAADRSSRTGDTGAVNGTQQLLTLLGNDATTRRFPNVVVWATTNLPWKLDSGLLRRLPVYMHIDVPSMPQKYAVIFRELSNKIADGHVKQMSPSDIERVQDALREALYRASTFSPNAMAMLTDKIRAMHPSFSTSVDVDSMCDLVCKYMESHHSDNTYTRADDKWGGSRDMAMTMDVVLRTFKEAYNTAFYMKAGKTDCQDFNASSPKEAGMRLMDPRSCIPREIKSVKDTSRAELAITCTDTRKNTDIRKARVSALEVIKVFYSMLKRSVERPSMEEYALHLAWMVDSTLRPAAK